MIFQGAKLSYQGLYGGAKVSLLIDFKQNRSVERAFQRPSNRWLRLNYTKLTPK
jgi:hypothetical protein